MKEEGEVGGNNVMGRDTGFGKSWAVGWVEMTTVSIEFYPV